MKYSETSWQTSDGLKIYAQEWRPEKTPVAAISLVHGVGEHSNRYIHVAKAFNKAGISVMAMDLRGHGKSEGIRGHFPSYPMVMGDITQLLEQTRQRNPGIPQFLYGNSLGGALVLYFGITQKYNLKGIIATSPGLAPGSPVSPITLTLGKALYSLVPALLLANGLNLDGLSHDPRVKKLYMEDPLVHNKISARLGIDLIKNGKWIVNHSTEFLYPLLLLQGSADSLVSPQKTRQLAQQMGEKVTFIWYEGMFNELHNETIKDQVFKDEIGWINGLL
jgi:alpha-beta hydrolase superfamily lysophospholipase